MGTETSKFKPSFRLIPLNRVKLNNPLMGTETLRLSFLYQLPLYIVKLNNPLMGTETSVPG